MAGLVRRLQRLLESRARLTSPRPAATLASRPQGRPENKPRSLRAEDLDRAAHVFKTAGTAPGGPWDAFRGSLFELPASFDHGLDPLSPAYAAQQDDLWRIMSGRREGYEPLRHEQTHGVAQIEPLVSPGFYMLDTVGAGDHLIALGHLVKLSGVAKGDRVLEYGAGFGQIALAFARLGALVDTVDISPEFCDAVTAQANWFNVPLTAHVEQFGYNPRAGEQYKLIVFYECFHHARNFIPLIERLREILADNGKILMAGEPIGLPGSSEIPYPWGMRLDAENSAVVRIRGWYEIGFQEDFLFQCFRRAGFVARKHPGAISGLATTYEFMKRPDVLRLSEWPLSSSDEKTWHGMEPNGRWTRAHATYNVDAVPGGNVLTVTAANLHPRPLEVAFMCGGQTVRIVFQPRERREVPLQSHAGDRLDIVVSPLIPRSYGVADDRSLGIFVEAFGFA